MLVVDEHEVCVMVDQSTPISEKRSRKLFESEELSPKRSFKDVFKSVERRPAPPPLPRKKNVFELSSEKEKKNHRETKEEPTNPQAPVQGTLDGLQEMPAIEVSTFSTDLSVQMQDLVEKMADHVLIESHNGISTTTVTIEMENPLSLFNGCEIIIEHYDTAPHSFNLQLTGSMQAVDEFILALPTLQAQLTERLSSFQIQLMPPVLTQREELKTERTRKSRREKKDEKTKKIPS